MTIKSLSNSSPCSSTALVCSSNEAVTNKAVESSGLDSHKNHASGKVPGILNIFFLPFDIIYTTSAYLHAKALGDIEGELDALIRLTGMPLNAVNSIFGFVTFIFQICSIFNTAKNYALPAFLATPINIAGLFLCVIESYFEIRGIERQSTFLDSMHYSWVEKMKQILSQENPETKRNTIIKLCEKLESEHYAFFPPKFYAYVNELKNRLLQGENSPEISNLALQLFDRAKTTFLEKDLETLKQNYLTLTEKEKEKIRKIINKSTSPLAKENPEKEYTQLSEKMLQVKMASLARRVQPWCAEEINSTLSPILENLRSHHPEIQKEGEKQAEELLKTVNEQTKKQLAIHVISLAALAISVVAFIGLLCACPPAVPIVLLSIGGTLATVSYFSSLGFLHSKGWTFSVSNCIPNFVKDGYQAIQNCASSAWENLEKTRTAALNSLQGRASTLSKAFFKSSYSLM